MLYWCWVSTELAGIAVDAKEGIVPLFFFTLLSVPAQTMEVGWELLLLLVSGCITAHVSVSHPLCWGMWYKSSLLTLREP